MGFLRPAIGLWIFTEHRNATYLINFYLPLQDDCRRGNVSLRVWSAEDIDRIGKEETLSQLSKLASHQRPTAIVLSRYVQPHAHAVMSWAASRDIPIYFHLDDLLGELPSDIGEKYLARYTDEFRADLRACLERADGLLASTELLAARLAETFPAKPVLTLQGVCYLPPDQWSCAGWRSRLARMRLRVQRRGVITIGYMGSLSHLRDLEPIVPAIAQLMSQHPTLSFETLGLPVPPLLVQRFPGRVRQFGFTMDYLGFLRALFELGWDLGVAPLVEDDFNRSKTATKFVEYTSCGIPTVTAAMPPYITLPAKVTCLASVANWADTIEPLLYDRDRRQELLRHAQIYCRTQYSVSSARSRLLNVLSAMRSNGPKVK